MPKMNHGRKRDLHPEFFTDERVLQVPIAARLLFEGLWTISDRAGRLEEPHPVTLKAKFLPVDDVDCGELLERLIAVGLVLRYEGDLGGGPIRLLFLPGLVKRTRFHPKEVYSRLPPHPSEGVHGPKVIPNPHSMTPKVVPGYDLTGHAEGVRRPGSSGSSGSIGIVGIDRDTPAPGSNPGRKRSWHFEVFEELQASRAEKMRELELTAEPDEELGAGFITTALKKIRDRVGDAMAIPELFDAYLAESWPASKTPPYPFRVFAAEAVWQKLRAQREVTS